MILPIGIKLLIVYLLVITQSLAEQAVLAEITNRLSKTAITQGDFQQQKHLKVLRKPLISSGAFTYHQSKGVIWQTKTPVASLLLINETKLLTGQNTQAVPAAFGKVFQAMLGGDLAALTEAFDISGSDHNTSWQLTLTPKDELLKKVIVGMQLSGDSELRRLDILEAGGNSSQINFTNINHPTHISPEQAAEFERLSP
ncbi:MAG: outer membrane lipoprotein carrier protein LolA [Methylococcales bacterium]